MINATVTYLPHAIANQAMTALANLDRAWENADALFREEAEEHYDDAGLRGWFATAMDKIRGGKRPEFDFDYELQLMEPIKTNEPLPDFYSAAEQYEYVKNRMAELHNRLGIIATACRTATATEVRLSADDYFWLTKMVEGENLLFRPTEPDSGVE